MARFVLTEPEEFSDTDINFVVEDYSGELIKTMDEVRKAFGFTDLVGSTDCDAWYNFYVDYNPKDDTFRITGTANETEEDDWVSYEITDNLSVDVLDEIEDAINEALEEMEEEEV